MSRPELVAYVPWASAAFTGAKVTMTGTPFENDSDIEIENAWVADVHRRSSGEVDLLIVCPADADPAADQQAINDRLCAAAETMSTSKEGR